MSFYFNPRDGKRYYVDDETGRYYEDSRLYGGQYTVAEVVEKKKEQARRRAANTGNGSQPKSQPAKRKNLFGF